MLFIYTKRFLMTVVLSSITLFAFAEDAPVYDVDNYPPFDNGSLANAPASAPVIKPETSPVLPKALTQEQRLARLEQQMANLNHADAASKTEAMRAEIQSLRGQVEELSHQVQQMQNQQRAMYTDLDKRLQVNTEKKSLADKVEVKEPLATSVAKEVPQIPATKKASTLPAKTTSSRSQPNAAEEQKIYQTAYDLIKEKKYNEAVNTLQKMLQKYPAGQFASNAHYWLGELYGLLNKNDQSATEFATVVKNYPDSSKVADAQLKLGLIYAAQLKWPEAKAAFKKVISRYPGTPSAQLASEQLKQLKQAQAGH